jgi:Family of unknown function (DUF6687)
MRYVPYYELAHIPNIIVDGPANQHTRLILSHWPHSGTPWDLKADLSAQIVFRYLDRPDLNVQVDAVSNNHFDEDGLIGLFSILNPGAAQAQRDLLIDIAAAGDFGTFKFRDAAKIAFVIGAFADEETSPLPAGIFRCPYPEHTSGLYQEMLVRLPEILAKLEGFRSLWEPQEQQLLRSEAAFRSGGIRIEEIPSVDLAIVTLPEDHLDCHQMAIHNTTNCFRILTMAGRKYELKYRYETWVQYVSARPLPRVDLGPLAKQLSEKEASAWKFDGVDAIIPRLYLENAAESRIPPEAFRAEVEAFLANAPPAWLPFDHH